MASVLSAAAKADLEYVVDYLDASNGLERPGLDDKLYGILARHYKEFGYSGQQDFYQDIFNRPIWTLFTVFLNLDKASGYLILKPAERARIEDVINRYLRDAENGLEKPRMDESFWGHVSALAPTAGTLAEIRDSPIYSMLQILLMAGS